VPERARRLAVVVFNLGGPDSLKAVRPFLFNLFADPSIIGLPAAVRLPLAGAIATIRSRSARRNYALIGGRSPLLAETEAQAKALEAELGALRPELETRVFIAMRYWRPLTREAAVAVEAFEPDEIVLAPLYPQYSTTTTGSSVAEWNSVYRGTGRVCTLCCYPAEAGLIEAHAQRIEAAWREAGEPEGVRLLFSAHGLPLKVVEQGDPYQSQVEATAAAIASRLGPGWPDWRVCYQSRVGPMKWLGPSTLDLIEEAASEGLGVVIAPIAFVSEHVETLVELDHDYARKAEGWGCHAYVRVPALGLQGAFISGLSKQVAAAIGQPGDIHPGSEFVCAPEWGKCPRRRGVQ
jgi:ferrochelatase